MTFDASQSDLQRNAEKVSRFISVLEGLFPATVSVIGAVEIGSFAKGEAIPTSDTDTRVYITCPEAMLVNLISEFEEPAALQAYLKVFPVREPILLRWHTFNAPMLERLKDEFGEKISFGFVDTSFAEFLFEHLERYPTQDHAMLFQSNVIYDPRQWIADWRARLEGRIFGSQVELYVGQAVNRARQKLPWYLDNPDNRRGPDQWLLQAVRCLREGIAARSYATTGRFVFRRDEVVQCIETFGQTHADLARTLYAWKCDPTVRNEICRSFERGDETWQNRFRQFTPRVQDLVELILSRIPGAGVGRIRLGVTDTK